MNDFQADWLFLIKIDWVVIDQHSALLSPPVSVIVIVSICFPTGLFRRYFLQPFASATLSMYSITVHSQYSAVFRIGVTIVDLFETWSQ